MGAAEADLAICQRHILEATWEFPVADSVITGSPVMGVSTVEIFSNAANVMG